MAEYPAENQGTTSVLTLSRIFMFSLTEKQRIAAEIEKLLLSLDHPEMPKEKPLFHLHVDGKEAWSWADIKPNWTFAELKPKTNPWNEQPKETMITSIASIRHIDSNN